MILSISCDINVTKTSRSPSQQSSSSSSGTAAIQCGLSKAPEIRILYQVRQDRQDSYVSCSVLITFHKCLIRYSSSFLNLLRIQPADMKGDLLLPQGFALTVCPHKLIFLRLAAFKYSEEDKASIKAKRVQKIGARYEC